MCKRDWRVSSLPPGRAPLESCSPTWSRSSRRSCAADVAARPLGGGGLLRAAALVVFHHGAGHGRQGLPEPSRTPWNGPAFASRKAPVSDLGRRAIFFPVACRALARSPNGSRSGPSAWRRRRQHDADHGSRRSFRPLSGRAHHPHGLGQGEHYNLAKRKAFGDRR